MTSIVRTTDQTLRDLAVRVGAGDHAAFRTLYAMFVPSTLAMVRTALPDVAHCAHVVRATFCEVWWMCAFDARRGIHRDDLPEWVASIAGRRCAERRHALAVIAASVLPTEETTFWTAFLADHDVWTQYQLATMLAGHRSGSQPPKQLRRG